MTEKIFEIRVEILKRRLHQADVAVEAKMSESKLSRILNSRVQPRPGELEQIAQAVESIGAAG